MSQSKKETYNISLLPSHSCNPPASVHTTLKTCSPLPVTRTLPRACCVDLGELVWLAPIHEGGRADSVQEGD